MILLVSVNAWARSDSLSKAKRELQRHLPRIGTTRLAGGTEVEVVWYDAPEGAWVDGLGRIRWENPGDGSEIKEMGRFKMRMRK